MALRLTLLIILTWIGVTAAPPQEAPQADTADYLTVEARYLGDPEPILVFELRSKHSEPFSMSEHDLPWGNAHSVRLTFLRPSGRDACPLYTAAIDDPFSDKRVTVEPDQTLEGAVRLANNCPDFLKVLKESAVTVEWEYRPVSGRRYTKDARGRITVQHLSEEDVR